MTTYLVTWEMHIEAESPEDAALQALRVHRDPESVATVFAVEHKGIHTVIDVENGEPLILRYERA